MWLLREVERAQNVNRVPTALGTNDSPNQRDRTYTAIPMEQLAVVSIDDLPVADPSVPETL